MRNERRIMTNKKKIVLISTSIILGIVITGSFSIKNRILNNNIAEAINVVSTLEIMNDKNPINRALFDEIEAYENKKVELILRAQRKKIEAEKILAEKEAIRIEEERIAQIKAEGKIAYLTFDDGPSKVITPQILDILNDYDIKATFFVIGYMTEKYPEVLKMTYEQGHTIGNHTYSHNYGYIYRNPASFLIDVEKSNETLKSILGQEYSTNIVRFPGGSFGAQKKPFITAVNKAGYTHFDWNSLNGDSEGVNISKERLIERFEATIKNKKELIILMHDTDQKATTVEALPEIIDILIDKGYIFQVLEGNNKR